MQLKLLFSLFALLPFTFSLTLPISPQTPNLLLARQSSGAKCGSDNYNSGDISAAQNAGCNYLNEGKTVGDDDYPHQYRDDEGFDFPVSGPWYEFPILKNWKVFTGSTSPGADRVIFNGDCELAGVITHTGASNDGFVECHYD